MNEQHDWLNAIASTQYAYLTTTGRKSGNPHRIEIWFGVSDGRIYLMSGGREKSDWVQNLIAEPVVSLEIGDQQVRGFATILEDGSDADRTARVLLVQKYQKKDELKGWGENSLAIAIDVID